MAKWEILLRQYSKAITQMPVECLILSSDVTNTKLHSHDIKLPNVFKIGGMFCLS